MEEKQFLDDIINSYGWDIDFNNNYNILAFDKININLLKVFKKLKIITDKDDLKYIGKLKPAKNIENYKKLATLNSLTEIQLQKNTYQFDFIANDEFLKFREEVLGYEEDPEEEIPSIKEIDINKNQNKNINKIVKILEPFNFDFKLLQYNNNDNNNDNNNEFELQTCFRAISLDDNDISLLINTVKYCDEFYIIPLYNFEDEKDEKCYGIGFAWYFEK